MGELADIYVAVKTRSKKLGIEFLNQFLPKRAESADEYQLPQYSMISEREFDTVDELMTFLEKNQTVEYNLYWRATDELNPNKHGMLFYTKDKAMIFGISRDAETDEWLNTKNEDECLNLMKEYFQTNIGYITYEDTPTNTYDEFVNRVHELNK